MAGQIMAKWQDHGSALKITLITLVKDNSSERCCPMRNIATQRLTILSPTRVQKARVAGHDIGEKIARSTRCYGEEANTTQSGSPLQKAGATMEGGEIAEPVPTDIEKKCSRCGERFQCKQEAGCWCASLHVEPATLLELRARYIDCLCEACLRKLAAGQD